MMERTLNKVHKTATFTLEVLKGDGAVGMVVGGETVKPIIQQRKVFLRYFEDKVQVQSSADAIFIPTVC